MNRMEERIPKTLDNKQSGRVIDELREGIRAGSRISLIAAGFSIYAYAALQEKLDTVDAFRLLLCGVGADVVQRAAQQLVGAREEIGLRQRLDQAAIARDCAAWLR